MIEELHSLLMHVGTEKLINYIKNNYDMENLKETVTKVTKDCIACQKRKVVTVATKEETIQLKANEKFEKIYVDICRPFQETFGKKK